MKTREERIAHGQLVLAQLLNPEEDVVHYGVKGMKWGQSKGEDSWGTGESALNEQAQGAVKFDLKAGTLSIPGGGSYDISESSTAEKVEISMNTSRVASAELSEDEEENEELRRQLLKNMLEKTYKLEKYDPKKHGPNAVEKFMNEVGETIDDVKRDIDKGIKAWQANNRKMAGDWVKENILDKLFDVKHSDIERGNLILAELLDSEVDIVHYGVPGMKWGKRKARGSASARQPSADHVEARQLNKKKLSELSNDELQRLTKRLDLEAKYRKTHPTRLQKAQKVLKQVVATAQTGQKVYKFIADTEQGKKAIAQAQTALKAAKK